MQRFNCSSQRFGLFCESQILGVALGFIHLSGWYFKRLAMGDSLTDYDMVRAAYFNAKDKADG